jgi:hypothetical protein
MIALFKNGDKSFPSNYRPISLLSCVSKIFAVIQTYFMAGNSLQLCWQKDTKKETTLQVG